MSRIWGVLKRRDKIIKEQIGVFEEELPDCEEVVESLCVLLDIPRPVVLSKHKNELEKFMRTSFMPSDFIESVGFSRFEIEILRERKKGSYRDSL